MTVVRMGFALQCSNYAFSPRFALTPLSLQLQLQLPGELLQLPQINRLISALIPVAPFSRISFTAYNWNGFKIPRKNQTTVLCVADERSSNVASQRKRCSLKLVLFLLLVQNSPISCDRKYDQCFELM